MDKPIGQYRGKIAMKYHNQKGIALIVVLIVAAIVIALSGIAYQFLIKSTIISGVNLRYQAANSALAAESKYTKWAIDQYRLNKSLTSQFGASDSSCLPTKLNNTTGSWGSCPATADPVKNYDIKLTLGNYIVYAQIVDTLLGNTKSGGNLGLNTGSTSKNKTGTNTVTPPAAPYLYRIEMIAEKPGDLQSQVSALFGY